MTDQAHAPAGMRVMYFVWIWLLVLTVTEVGLAYMQMPVSVMLGTLLALSFVKAGMIMSWFMHLKFERMSLVATIIPAMVMCLLLMNIIWGDGWRLRNRGVFRDLSGVQTGQIEKPASE